MPNLSTLVTNTIPPSSISADKLSGGQSGSAPIYGCRAWVRFDPFRDASGATNTLNTNRFLINRGNVTSVLRNSTGDYTITFTVPMPNTDYAILGTTGTNDTSVNALICYELNTNSRTNTTVRVGCGNNEIDQSTDPPGGVNVMVLC